MSFNSKHPELLEGENFVVNLTKKEAESFKPNSIHRIGKKAYDTKGNLIKDRVPLFVKNRNK